MKLQIVLISVSVILGGCVSTHNPDKPIYSHSHYDYRPDSRDTALMQNESKEQVPEPVFIHKRLSDYADQLAMSLLERAFSLKTSDRIAVASFVRFDKTLREPTALGNRLSEAMISELQHYGMTVVDTKLSSNLAITEKGDLALARDYPLLKRQLNVDYILTGTLIQRVNGVEVNARVIGVEGNQVAATSSLFIPDFVVSNEVGKTLGG